MKKASDVFKSIRFAKGETRDKPHKSTDEEGHYSVGEKEFNQQLKHVKKMAMQEEKKDKYDEGEYDQEGDMAKSDLRSIIANAKRVHDMFEDDDNLPEWVQSKITKAEDYISTVANYMEAEMNEETDLKESGGDVVYKKGDHHIEKYGEDAFALYSNGKKQKYYTSIEAAKEAMKEEVELDEENKPTNPELWARAKAMAKSKFDVYPSAYANGWAAKWYKSKGGGWRSVNEENYEVTVMHTTKDGDKGEKTHKITNANDSRHAKNIALQRHEKMLSSKGKEVRGMATTTAKMVEAKKDDLPFTPDKPKKKSIVVGKKPEGYSVARHLARQAMQKYMKKPVKEETMSKKTKIVKDVMKKSSSDDKFQAEPMISQSIIRNN